MTVIHRNQLAHNSQPETYYTAISNHKFSKPPKIKALPLAKHPVPLNESPNLISTRNIQNDEAPERIVFLEQRIVRRAGETIRQIRFAGSWTIEKRFVDSWNGVPSTVHVNITHKAEACTNQRQLTASIRSASSENASSAAEIQRLIADNGWSGVFTALYSICHIYFAPIVTLVRACNVENWEGTIPNVSPASSFSIARSRNGA